MCLEFNELVPDVLSLEEYKYHQSKKDFKIHNDESNGREVFIEFETLPPNYKKAINFFYGDPYKYYCEQQILKTLKFDYKAQEFFQNYNLENGKMLPGADYDQQGKKQINYVQRYTEAANWLNLFIELTSDKAIIKKEFNVTISQFWTLSIDLMKAKQINLPYSYKRLKQKIKGYQEEGYPYLIETHKFGNDYAKK
ncbi:hypothetical protein [Winogradskyella sp. 3972H.M.0a.05]|uniref:hypothetical protein n=1 Tax=Winogradskyella sp. 3972H.M.0a.05 TaxID=2950277 RepID=UPI0033912422